VRSQQRFMELARARAAGSALPHQPGNGFLARPAAAPHPPAPVRAELAS
jgi:hypothetical protein